MRILLDQGVPVPLRAALVGHACATAFEMEWSRLKNGELLSAAERESFDLLVTTDQSLRYQQNLAGRRLAVLVLPTTNWPQMRSHVTEIAAAVTATRPGEFLEVRW